ncbi:MAG: DUF488 domain-containing protein, partial [Thermoplasmata archaeon]
HKAKIETYRLYTMPTEIILKRIYDPEGDDGYRILVERLWPRGISKDEAHIDYWAKDIAPTSELRRWYSHDPDKWNEFREKYFKELINNPKTTEFKELVSKHDKVTFLFASREVEKNSANLLKDFILND